MLSTIFSLSLKQPRDTECLGKVPVQKLPIWIR